MSFCSANWPLLSVQKFKLSCSFGCDLKRNNKFSSFATLFVLIEFNLDVQRWVCLTSKFDLSITKKCD
jgi:hypothetical protein